MNLKGSHSHILIIISTTVIMKSKGKSLIKLLFFSLHSNISSVSRDGEFDYDPWSICTFNDLVICFI